MQIIKFLWYIHSGSLLMCLNMNCWTPTLMIICQYFMFLENRNISSINFVAALLEIVVFYANIPISFQSFGNLDVSSKKLLDFCYMIIGTSLFILQEFSISYCYVLSVHYVIYSWVVMYEQRADIGIYYLKIKISIWYMYLKAFKPKWVNPISKIIGVDSLRLGGLHSTLRYFSLY